jgi:hypothetical protein
MESGLVGFSKTPLDDDMAEGKGFEPSGAIHPADFESAALPLC